MILEQTWLKKIYHLKEISYCEYYSIILGVFIIFILASKIDIEYKKFQFVSFNHTVDHVDACSAKNFIGLRNIYL